MTQSPALRLTPSNSPFLRSSTPRSPTKSSRNEESGLKLKKVIGTTCANASGFAALPCAKQFAYTAGAAAVVCTIEDNLNISQRFLRARPSAAGSRDGYFPPTPNPELRSRAIGNLRDHNANASPLGASMRDWLDSPTGKTATAKDRVKAATSVSLSPNGKWVAVGETGYKPRILIFANKGDASEAPICALSEHTFGVHALAFSPDSRFLASLGTVNDGFLYIWAIDRRTGFATLHSSNKCTSTINLMTWLGQNVLTIGLRYIKLWKPDDGLNLERRPSESASTVATPKIKASEFGNSVSSPRHKVLSGKNSLLGDLLDANFIAAVPYDVGKAIICAETGEVCLLDASDTTQTLVAMGTVGFRITAAMSDQCGNLHVSGMNGHSRRFNAAEMDKRGPISVRKDRRSILSPLKTTLSLSDAFTTTALAKIDDILIELDSRRGIRLTKAPESRAKDLTVASHQLVAHSEAVLGVKCLVLETLPEAAFTTFSGNGLIHIWNADGAAVASHQVPVESSAAMYDTPNELKAVANSQTASVLFAGDKYGILSVLDILTGSIKAQVRAHSAEIVDVICFERRGIQLIATASRDRMVQLFAWRSEGLEILQTMDEHAAALSGLAIIADGNFLLSCSSDRTIVVREAMLRVDDDPESVAFITLRTITLKSSPLSMCLGENEDNLLVSMVDRTICRYNIKNGQAGFSFKCSDAEGGEAAAMSKILYAPSLNGNPTIVGVSSGDKSVRLYSEYGSLIARDWGHTEGITDAALLQARGKNECEAPAQLITVAADSTIFMWDTCSQATIDQSIEANGALDPLSSGRHTPLAPPLRKVLSHSELSRFRSTKSNGEDESQPMPVADEPPSVATPTQLSPSPRRLRNKSSRTSVLQGPRLEPTLRSSNAQSRRESSTRRRSPSPTSPKGKQGLSRKPSLGMSLRSKSSESILSSCNTGHAPSFGSIASSTEAVCRNLRAYRKKLAVSSSDAMTSSLLRELATELKLTARVVGEKSQGKVVDEVIMTKLLDQASDRLVDRLDERIKERIECEVRRSSGTSPLSNGSMVESSADIDAVAGALGKLTVD